MAAPIFDHEGRLAAALDVSSCRADLTAGFAQLISIAVADAAHKIEAGNFRLAFPDDRLLLLSAPDRAGSALVAVDADELVVGATRSARAMFGITSARLREGLPVSDLLGGEDETDEFEKAQPGP